MLSARLVAASLVLLLSSAVARAETSEAPGATAAPALDDETAARVMASLTQPETESHWYGAELLLADGAGLVSLSLLSSLYHEGPGSDATHALATVAVGSLALTPAIIHASHGRYGAAAGSIALRVGMPAAGLAMGVQTCAAAATEDDWCLGPPLLGFAAGALGAMLIDDLVLAREDRRIDPGEPRIQFGMAPSANHGMTFSLGGSF